MATEIIQSFLQGYNGTILAYGQTASGKTYTTLGTSESPGCVPLAIASVASAVQSEANHYASVGAQALAQVMHQPVLQRELRAALSTRVAPDSPIESVVAASLPQVHRRAQVAYLEVYNEEVYDLLQGHSITRTWKSPAAALEAHLPAMGQSQASAGAPQASGSPIPPTCIASVELPGQEGLYATVPPSEGAAAGQGQRQPLRILGDDPAEGALVHGMWWLPIARAEDARAAVQAGELARSYGAHAMNRDSSRSHVMFRLKLITSIWLPSARAAALLIQGLPQAFELLEEARALGPPDAKPGRWYSVVSYLNVVDLAGSERALDTGATGQRLREAGAINKSLSVLARVVAKLSKGGQLTPAASSTPGRSNSLTRASSTPRVHVPVRDSKLTRLLAGSLGGNAQCALIATLNPGIEQVPESIRTLQFAASCSSVATCARRHVLQYERQGSIPATRHMSISSMSEMGMPGPDAGAAAELAMAQAELELVKSEAAAAVSEVAELKAALAQLQLAHAGMCGKAAVLQAFTANLAHTGTSVAARVQVSASTTAAGPRLHVKPRVRRHSFDGCLRASTQPTYAGEDSVVTPMRTAQPVAAEVAEELDEFGFGSEVSAPAPAEPRPPASSPPPLSPTSGVPTAPASVAGTQPVRRTVPDFQLHVAAPDCGAPAMAGDMVLFPVDMSEAALQAMDSHWPVVLLPVRAAQKALTAWQQACSVDRHLGQDLLEAAQQRVSQAREKAKASQHTVMQAVQAAEAQCHAFAQREADALAARDAAREQAAEAQAHAQQLTSEYGVLATVQAKHLANRQRLAVLQQALRAGQAQLAADASAVRQGEAILAAQQARFDHRMGELDAATSTAQRAQGSRLGTSLLLAWRRHQHQAMKQHSQAMLAAARAERESALRIQTAAKARAEQNDATAAQQSARAAELAELQASLQARADELQAQQETADTEVQAVEQRLAARSDELDAAADQQAARAAELSQLGDELAAAQDQLASEKAACVAEQDRLQARLDRLAAAEAQLQQREAALQPEEAALRQAQQDLQARTAALTEEKADVARQQRLLETATAALEVRQAGAAHVKPAYTARAAAPSPRITRHSPATSGTWSSASLDALGVSAPILHSAGPAPPLLPRSAAPAAADIPSRSPLRWTATMSMNHTVPTSAGSIAAAPAVSAAASMSAPAPMFSSPQQPAAPQPKEYSPYGAPTVRVALGFTPPRLGLRRAAQPASFAVGPGRLLGVAASASGTAPTSTSVPVTHDPTSFASTFALVESSPKPRQPKEQ